MSVETKVRIPPTTTEVEQLFAGWRDELASCRKFAPNARNYAVARLLAGVGLRINEARMLDFADVRWELGKFGKLNVRHGKGSRRKGPKQRLVPLLNGTDAVLAWYIEDVLGQFDSDFSLPGSPLFPSERLCSDGPGSRLSREAVHAALQVAVENHLPSWAGKVSLTRSPNDCRTQRDSSA
jgi:integrase